MQRRGFWLSGLAALAAAIATTSAAEHHEQAHEEEHGMAQASGRIDVISGLVGGKNVFIPSTIVIEADEPATLSIFNTTEIPHGFRIQALGIETVLPVGEEHEVKIPAQEEGIYRIDCQLHPPHRNATLLVIDPD